MFQARSSASLVLAATLVPAIEPAASDSVRILEMRLDANRIATRASNVGSFGHAYVTADADFEYPRGSGLQNFVALGLWVSAQLNGQPEAAVCEYGSEFRPGPMVGGSFVPFDSTYRVYRVARSDTAGSADWMAHAVSLGAPTDASGTNPGVLGSQTLWAIYNDADSTRHTQSAGRTPLGLEVRQTTWAFREKGRRDNAVLLRWRIENRGPNTLDSTYVAVWADFDAGGRVDQFGSDPLLRMAYVYQGAIHDPVYGDSTPAIGVRLLEGARATPGGPDLGATAMPTYVSGADPRNALEIARLVRGLRTDGSPWIDPTSQLATPFPYACDPRDGSGWIDGVPGDEVFLIASGPFTMAPGDTQQITAALVVGWGPENATSVDSLYANAQADFFAPPGEEYVDPPPPPPPPVPALALYAWPNPARGAIRLSFVPPSGAPYRLALFDLRGRHLITLERGTGTGGPVSHLWVPLGTSSVAQSGVVEAPWPSSGMYFAVLDVDGKRTTKRIALIGR